MKDVYELSPTLKEYIWAGTKLKKYKKTTLNKIAESWELSFLDEGLSLVVENGSLLPLREVINKQDLGSKIDNYVSFPVLIKLIDSGDSLSIQVHPNDYYALKNEHSNGKTEMWIILEAEENSFIYYGFKENIKKENFKDYINDDRVLNSLNKVFVKKGDIFLIEPGTIHAIGKGITLLEIQESSNITYRVYDFNRVDKFGKKRDLHISKALDVINFNKLEITNLANSQEIKSKYFDVLPYKINGKKKLLFKDTFCVITVIEGEGTINDIDVKKYHSYFIKANTNIFINGNLDVVITKLP